MNDRGAGQPWPHPPSPCRPPGASAPRGRGQMEERRGLGRGGVQPLGLEGARPCDSLLQGLICTLRAGPCNSDHSFRHPLGKDPNPAGSRLFRDSAEPTPHGRSPAPFGFCPHPRFCSCRCWCLGRPSSPGPLLSGPHLRNTSFSRKPSRTADTHASGPPSLLSPVLSFSLQALRGVRLTVGCPPV